jgi:hypothetical protein
VLRPDDSDTTIIGRLARRQALPKPILFETNDLQTIVVQTPNDRNG